MRIIIDGDSSPVINEAFDVGDKTGTPVKMFCSYAHFSPERQGDITLVDSEYQAVDMVIANHLLPGDILVADDIGLAAIALGKGAKVVSSRGHLFDDENIDQALFQRFLGAKARRGGGRTKGHSKLLAQDKKRFKEVLHSLIEGEL